MYCTNELSCMTGSSLDIHRGEHWVLELRGVTHKNLVDNSSKQAETAAKWLQLKKDV